MGRSFVRWAMATAIFWPLLASAQLTLHYNERPPYLVGNGGELSGLVGSLAADAFKAAKLPYQLQLTPTARQLHIIRRNDGQDCALGWFKNSERLAYAKFTKPIYRDRPMIALMEATNRKAQKDLTIAEILKRRDLVLLVKQGYSYGKQLDELVARFDPPRVAVSVENLQMLRIILAGRADYMFVAPEEADGLISVSGIDPARLGRLSFSDAPNGEWRYILCSMKVGDEVIERLNQVIR